MSLHYAEIVNQSEEVICIKNKDCQVSLNPLGSSLIDKITYDSLVVEIKVFMVLGKVKINLNGLNWNVEQKEILLEEKLEEVGEKTEHPFVPSVTIAEPIKPSLKKEFKKNKETVKLNLDK